MVQTIKRTIQKLINSQRGMTLVELLVGIALLSAVLAIGYTAYSFAYNSFTRGEARSDVRQNVRLAADFITQELRYATHVRVFNAIPALSDFAPGGDHEGYKSIYVDNGSFKYVNSEGNEESPFSSIDGRITLYNLSFNLTEGMFLEYEVKHTSGDGYGIDSKLKFLNSLEEIVGNLGIAVVYKSEPPAGGSPYIPSDDATLNNLSINGVTVTGFDSGTFTYYVQLPIGTNAGDIEVTATANHAQATLNITQATAFPGTATVVVTAEDGITQLTYTILFTLEPSPSQIPPALQNMFDHEMALFAALGFELDGDPAIELTGSVV